MKPRMLVVDLDGTALRHDNTLAPEDIEAARSLAEAGVHVTIATGRLYGGTGWVAEQLGIEGTVAVMNGSERVDVSTGQRAHHDRLDPTHRAFVRQVVAEHGLSAVLFRSGAIHHDARDQAHAPYLATWTPELVGHERFVADGVWDSAHDTLAIGVFGAHAAVDEAYEALVSIPPPLGILRFDTYTGERFLKLRNRNETKGTALRAMAAERGLQPEEVVAVGDWLNDLDLLRAAGRSYAMRGSIDAVVDVADGVLDAERGRGGAIAEIARRDFGL